MLNSVFLSISLLLSWKIWAVQNILASVPVLRKSNCIQINIKLFLKGQKDVFIATSVFGRLREQKEGLSPSISVSQKDGTLEFSNYKFYPMGTNQFGQNERIALFVQVFSPGTKLQQKPQLFLYKDKNQISEIPGEIVDEEWDRKTKIQNMVLLLNFSGIPKGEYVLEMIIPSLTEAEKPALKNFRIKILWP